MVKRTAVGSLFHKEGPMHAKDLDWTIEVLTLGTKRSSRSEDWRGWREMAEREGEEWGQKVTSELDQVELLYKMRTLNCMRSERGGQWSCSSTNVDMWENWGRWVVSLAAAFSTDCRWTFKGGQLGENYISLFESMDNWDKCRRKNRFANNPEIEIPLLKARRKW